MMTLTIWQPWAQLIALGVKTIETRSWSTDYRGSLAIHAAKKRPPVLWANVFHDEGPDYLDEQLEPSYDAQECVDGETWRYEWTGALGAVVATCKLTDVVPIGDLCFALANPQMSFGDFTPGRFAWLLADVRPLAKPVLTTGRQGLYHGPYRERVTS